MTEIDLGNAQDRLRRGYEAAAAALLGEATPNGHWEGELSSSPLSTATAITAMELVRRQQPRRNAEFVPLIQGGLNWLAEHQNEDGGWGDTIISHSNISTTTLAYASFHIVQSLETSQPTFCRDEIMARSQEYIHRNGGFEAIRSRYGKDRTFSVPILTQCALAGLIPWRELTPLPFELGWLPHEFYRWIRLPVVSYALPALIAIGQVRHHFAPSWNPLVRLLRQIAIAPTLRRLESIQPESGGFLEATPLTSFVTMSLAASGRADHRVAQRGIDFLKASVRSDGSWPIDTNLATWVTTLSISALRSGSIPQAQSNSIASWLLGQQHRIVHRYTNAAPGGWAWTDLSGGVPDADDTPGAILALLKINPQNVDLSSALAAAVEWLLNLQNSDGGWPTFCRGWGALPFDRSAPDLTAHAIRALRAWRDSKSIMKESRATNPGPSKSSPEEAGLQLIDRINRAIKKGFSFLERTQKSDGTWRPLWFGNQFSSDEENPVYGVSKSLAAYHDSNLLAEPTARRALKWLASVQNGDGGWGGSADTPSSTEETALAVEALLPATEFSANCRRGIAWLLDRVETEKFRDPAPIGLYFAKLWYFERLYPIIFTASALARAVEWSERQMREEFPAKNVDPLHVTST